MKPKSLIVLAVLLTLLAAGAWFGRGKRTPPAPVAPPATESTLEFTASDVATLEKTTLSRSIPLTGTLKAVDQTLVRAKVAGELRELAVREGMTVSAGQRIALVDPTDFEARVKEREAVARSTEAQVEQNRRTLENNRALLGRNFISQNAFDNSQSGYDVAIANRDAAIAQLAQARKALADTVVTAPMSGMVAERFVQPGEKVSPDARIVSIVDLSRMEIEAPVPANEIGSVRIGQTVLLRVEGVDGEQTGKIIRINPATATGTRSVPVYIGIDNRHARIRAGLFAQGALAVESRANVIAVPAAALREAAGRTFVYAIDANGRIAERDVQTGLRDDTVRTAGGSVGIVEIRSGLAVGDRIVAVNLGALRPGSIARVAAASASTPAPPAAPAPATAPAK